MIDIELFERVPVDSIEGKWTVSLIQLRRQGGKHRAVAVEIDETGVAQVDVLDYSRPTKKSDRLLVIADMTSMVISVNDSLAH